MTPRPRRSVAELNDYTGPELLDFGARVRAHRNESAFPLPGVVLDAVRNLDPAALRHYPADRYPALAELVGSKLGVASAEMMFASGSDDLILAFALAYGGEGRSAVVPRPAFGMYRRAALLHGFELREVPYRERWRLDAGAVLAACDASTSLIFAGNPNNPTGDALEPETLERILRGAPQALVVVDEAYLAGANGSYFAWIGEHPNLAVISTLSKIPGLAGLRAGFGAASAEVAQVVRRVMQPHTLTSPALAAMTAYFTHVFDDAAYVDAYRAFVAASLDRLVSQIGPLANAVTRGACNFAVFEFGERSASIAAALEACGIFVRRLSAPEFDGALRINALSRAETEEVIEAVKAAVEVNYA